MRNYYRGIAILSVLVVFVILGGIIQTGGPLSAKNVKLDEERINNFQEISAEVNSIHATSYKLPSSLEYVVENRISSKKLKINDPETDKVYDYKVISPTSYSLCTSFSTDSHEVSEKYEGYYFYDSYSNKMKNHKKGYNCISYTVGAGAGTYNQNYNYEDSYLNRNNQPIEIPVTPVESVSDIYSCSNFKQIPLSSISSGNIKALDAVSEWIKEEDGINICLVRAYLSPSLVDMDERNKSFINPDDKHYLSLEFKTRNIGTNSIHLVGADFLRLNSQGINSSPIAGNQYYAAPQVDLKFNSVFLVEPNLTKFVILFGDLNDPNMINLDFSKAKTVGGKLYWERGYSAN